MDTHEDGSSTCLIQQTTDTRQRIPVRASAFLCCLIVCCLLSLRVSRQSRPRHCVIVTGAGRCEAANEATTIGSEGGGTGGCTRLAS